jgi:PAS domain S-box-containing protein
VEASVFETVDAGVDSTWLTSQSRYQAMFEQAAVGIEEVARDGRFLMVNPAVCAMLGYERTELLQRRVADITHPDDLAVDERLVAGLWAHQSPSCHHEKRYVRKDGTTIWVKVTSSLVATPHGERPCRLGIVEDITERRALEEQLRQSQKMEAVGCLAAGIAHDFNNLLTAILGYADLVTYGLPVGHPASRELEALVKAAETAASLPKQLLAFSRKQVLAPRVLALNEVVRGVDKLLRRVIGEDVALSLCLDEALSCVCVDANQIEQVMLNLAVNARDAMPTGGMITVETENVLLDRTRARTLRPCPPGPYVRLSVSDSGVGMSPEVQARVFEPFFTTKELGRGTGLGLAMVYGIVKQSRGYIFVTSQPGCGTRFDIYFPPAAPEAAEALTPVASAPGRGETILLVEDDAAIRDLAEQALRRHDYAVLTAANASEASEALEHHAAPVDLLLTDVVMPGDSGPLLATRLTARCPWLRVLYTSGYSNQSMDEHGLTGAFALLQKPYSPTTLVRTVRQVLDAERPGL